jgi:glycosyltransferase involved in cell wall biosynthesis
MQNNFDSNKIAILIPSRNRNNILDTTIKSIFKAKSFCFERDIDVDIIVIDDSSDIPIQKYSEIVVIRNEEPLGESGAVNIGWSRTNARFVVVVSDDDPQQEDWLANLYEIASRTPGHGVYYPTTIEVTNNGKKLCTHVAMEYNRNKFQRLLRCPVLAGALIDREQLHGSVLSKPRVEVDFPSDLIQWLRFSTQTSFFACPSVYAYWVRSEIQHTNYFVSSVAASALVYATQEWSKIEKIPLPILLGIIGRIIQFNSRLIFKNVEHISKIYKIIYTEYGFSKFMIEALKTFPYTVAQLMFRTRNAN